MRRHRFHCSLALAVGILTLVSAESSAQGRRGLGFGGWTEGALISAAGGFRELPGVETCATDSGRVEDGTGWSAAAGAHMEWPDAVAFGDVRLWLTARVGAARSTIGLDSRERIGEVVDGRGNPADLIVTHDRTVALTALELGLRTDVRFADGTHFGLLAGGDASVPLVASYTYVERISEPAEASYLEGGTERNAQSGSLDAATVVLGVRGGIFGEWELARRTWLRAELAGTRGLTSLLDSVELTTGTLRLSLSITWSADGDSTPIKAED